MALKAARGLLDYGIRFDDDQGGYATDEIEKMRKREQSFKCRMSTAWHAGGGVGGGRGGGSNLVELLDR